MALIETGEYLIVMQEGSDTRVLARGQAGFVVRSPAPRPLIRLGSPVTAGDSRPAQCSKIGSLR
jgi:hypothetical protein